MTKKEITSKIAQTTGIMVEDIQITLDAFFEQIKDNMAEGNTIYLRGFGTFKNMKRKKKMGMVIKKKLPMVIEAHYTPTFKPSIAFKKHIKSHLKVE